MDTDRSRIRRIFDEAAELSPVERAAFLDRECASDPALREHVEALLKSLDDAGEFLASSEAGPLRGSRLQGFLGASVLREGAGSRIGPYKLLQQIGEGGFGVVFLAEQQTPVVRRVALKIIKLGMDTKQVIARFEAERQALALMDHPNIAKVLDAGATETGRPYFVMELVRGEPITAYCDRENLSTTERLGLFVDVCHAIQHAHQKGIIHRDIKPTNILVTVADGRAIPKVIDFGIAKATIARLTEKTLFTEHRQLIGTPEYMSPEQAEMSAVDIDTRSDIYSLGVLLYELLTGTTPFDVKQLRSAAFNEIQRIIREVEPPKPSTRISTLGEALSGIASHRHTDPSKLGRLVRGDLDWIVMKALEKERSRRYESVSGLARDIEHHLQHEPVVAGPPGRAYRLRKFVRRNRATVLAAAIVLAALVLGVIGTTVELVRALEEQRRADAALLAESDERRLAQENEAKAQAEATRAKTVLAVLNDLLQPPEPGSQDANQATKAPTIGEPEGTPEGFSDRFGAFAQAWGLGEHDDPAIEVEVRLMLGRTLRTGGLHAAAVKQFGRAVELRRRLSGELDGSLGIALSGQVEAISAGGDRSGAVRIARDAVERARSAGPDDPELAERLHLFADACVWAGDFAAAEAPSKEALALRERRIGHRQVRVADNLSQLAGIAEGLGRWDEAAGYYRDSAALHRELQGELHTSTWAEEKHGIELLKKRHDYAGRVVAARDAVERARTAMPPDATPAERRALAVRLDELVNGLRFVPDGGDEHMRAASEALGIWRARRDEDPAELADSLGRICGACWMAGRYDEAERYTRERLALTRDRADLAGPHAASKSSLAQVLLFGADNPSDARLAEAETMAREALAFSRQYNPAAPWTVWILDLDVALIRRMRGDEVEAQELERDAAAVGSRGILLSLDVACGCERLADRFSSLGQHATAEPILAAREHILEVLCPGHWLRYDAMSALGANLGSQGKFTQGEWKLLESIEHLRADPATPPDRLRRTLEQLAEFYVAWNAAEPGQGRDAQAAEWRQRLAEHDAAHGAEKKPR